MQSSQPTVHSFYLSDSYRSVVGNGMARTAIPKKWASSSCIPFPKELQRLCLLLACRRAKLSGGIHPAVPSRTTDSSPLWHSNSAASLIAENGMSERSAMSSRECSPSERFRTHSRAEISTPIASPPVNR